MSSELCNAKIVGGKRNIGWKKRRDTGKMHSTLTKFGKKKVEEMGISAHFCPGKMGKERENEGFHTELTNYPTFILFSMGRYAAFSEKKLSFLDAMGLSSDLLPL